MAQTCANTIQHPLPLLGSRPPCDAGSSHRPTRHTSLETAVASKSQPLSKKCGFASSWMPTQELYPSPPHASTTTLYRSSTVMLCWLATYQSKKNNIALNRSQFLTSSVNSPVSSRIARCDQSKFHPGWHAHLRSGQVVRGNARVQNAFWHGRCGGVGSIGWDGRGGCENNCVGGCYKAPANASHEGCVIR